MPRRNRTKLKRQNEDGRSSFRWPSRAVASRAERAAAVAADQGLGRIRARAEALRTRPEAAAPQPASPPRTPDPEPRPKTPPRFPDPEPREPVAANRAGPGRNPDRTSTPPPEKPPAAAPQPWDEELDALTEQLVEELRRDLGPAQSA